MMNIDNFGFQMGNNRSLILNSFNQMDMDVTKPLVIVNTEGVIIFINEMAESLFNWEVNSRVSNFSSDPRLNKVIESCTKNNLKSFQSDFILYSDKLEHSQEYKLEFEKISIEDEELFLFIFKPAEEYSIIEDKLNTLHNALEFGDIDVIITDTEGTISYISKSFEKFINEKLENIYHQNISVALKSFLSKEDIIQLNEAIKNKSQWIKLISDISKSGDLWFKELKINPVSNNEIDTTHFIITANDITNHILKNRIFRKSEQRQRLIINNISDLLIIIRQENDKYIFENANDNFYTEFKIDKNDSKEKIINEILPYGLSTDLYDAIEYLNQSHELNKQFRYTDNEVSKEFLCKLTYTDDPYDNIRLFILSMQDITEQILNEARLRKAFEKENELNKLKSAFLANMSHEVRTPVNAIVGYSDLLEDEIDMGDKESLRELTGFLKDGVGRLLNLVDNIVEVSMLESGQTEFDIDIYKVNNLLRNVYEAYYNKVTQKNLEFIIELDPADLQIEMDEIKFRRMMENLIDNAIKYNKPNGKVIIRSSKLADMARIEIEDTGIGIEESKINKILEPFSQQEDEGYRRNYEGAGLGLTISYKLSQQLNGRLDMKSKLDKGTIIYLTFPIV